MGVCEQDILKEVNTQTFRERKRQKVSGRERERVIKCVSERERKRGFKFLQNKKRKRNEKHV